MSGSLLRTDTSLYALQAISSCGNRQYSIKLVGPSESIEAVCEVKRADGEKIGAFDFVEFKSDRFNDLCT